MDERPLYREVLAINRAIASAEGYDEVLRLVVEKTAAFTGATACMLVLAQQDGLARIVRSVGIDPVAAAGLAIPLTGGIDRELCRLLGCQSPDQFVGVPVTGKEGLLGILGIYWQGARALEGASEDELLSALADQAAIALDNIERGHRLRASAEALRMSKERFRHLVETTSDWLWEVDENGVYTYASPLVRQLLGYEPEEVLGRTPFDLMPPEEAGRWRRPSLPSPPSAGRSRRSRTPIGTGTGIWWSWRRAVFRSSMTPGNSAASGGSIATSRSASA